MIGYTKGGSEMIGYTKGGSEMIGYTKGGSEMIAYKLTTQKMTTHGGFKFRMNRWRVAKGKGNKLCTDGVLHQYRHPVLAVIFNLIHARFINPKLWEIEHSGEVAFDGLKAGTKKQRLVREMPLPAITTEQRVEFAIRVTMRVYKDDAFTTWATGWLDGSDRSERAEAWAAARSAGAEAWAAEAWAAAGTAAGAAAGAAGAAVEAAAWAAGAAAWAAGPAERAEAWAAARAARAAAEAAEAAAGAAGAATMFMDVLAEMGLD